MLTKPIVFVGVVLLSFCLLFGYLSYKFYGDLSEARSEVVQLERAISSLKNSNEKLEKECKIQDSIVSEFNQENKGIEQKKQDTLDKIDSIPKKGTISHEKGLTTNPTTNVDKEANETIDIYTELPQSLVRLLNEAYNSSTRQGKSDAK